jgi:ribosomal protein S18 acetylase RimI-like enzyme
MANTNRITIVDVTDGSAFVLVPPCADPGFDHRSCDYWEDADRGSRAARLDWLRADPPEPAARPSSSAHNPFLDEAARAEVPVNPFAPPSRDKPAINPFLSDDDQGEDNPFAPTRSDRPTADGAPRKLRLLARGLGVVGSYAKVLLVDDEPAVYCQFGPLTAYPRAQRTRELYPALPDAPLPAVITCIATTADARGAGLGQRLVVAVIDDLTARGFAAVETYPEVGAAPDATSAATPAFWEAAGFTRAADDDRFPVMRRELT